MKICIECNFEKEDDEFSFRNKSRNLRNSKCKSCHKEYAKNHYQKNKSLYIKRAFKSSVLYRKRNQQFICDYLLNHPCVDCDESDIIVLDFDHKNQKTKTIEISKMISNYSWERILEEIEKCDVRCANCHRRRTAKQVKNYKIKYARMVELADTPASKTGASA